MRVYMSIAACLLLALHTGCQSAPESASPAKTGSRAERAAADRGVGVIHVVSNGWHTGIVLPRSDLLRGRIAEIDDFPRAEFFEFSWGDARYFPAPKKDLGMVMRALFTPTPAVLHLAGLPAEPRKVFPDAEIVDLELSSEGLQNLLAYLDQSFDRSAANSALPGLYRFSRFYPATGRFHLFDTCNTWTARGLKAAGVPVTVTGTLQAEELMAQLR
jgi:uncharacterized protein (TIGR02117 family)